MNSENKNSINYSGPGLFGFMFLIFMALKLIGIAPVANWSWWWVTAPLWIPVSVAVGILVVLAGILIVYDLIEDRRRK